MEKNLKLIKPNVKLPTTQLMIAISGVFVAVFGLRLFNDYLLMSFSLPLRMLLMIVTQWLLFLVPGMLMLINKETFKDIGLRKEKMPLQIGIGLLLAVAMSLVLTVLPIMLGFKEMVGTIRYTQIWQFIYQFLYAIAGVALAEELIFRGFLFKRLLEMKHSRWFAIIVSSLLFGIFHIFTGNLIQVLMTAFLGFLFCLSREKIKGCSLLSLIVAHGVYDALIVLWVSLL